MAAASFSFARTWEMGELLMSEWGLWCLGAAYLGNVEISVIILQYNAEQCTDSVYEDWIAAGCLEDS